MIKYNGDLNDLYKTSGYTFKSTEYLTLALTHSSYANENRMAKTECNERLEFFGDSILSLLVSEYMFFKYPDLPEGELTRTRAAVICEDGLYVLANKIDLGAHLRLGKGEEQNNGREKRSIVADAFEAFLASVYIDGGRKSAEDFLYPLIIPSSLFRKLPALFLNMFLQERMALTTIRYFTPMPWLTVLP